MPCIRRIQPVATPVHTTIISAALLLAACGGGDGSRAVAGAKSCVGSLAGGGTTVTTSVSCTACGDGDKEKAIDGRGDTYAFASLVGGTYTIRATAQSGIVYPAGNFAGAFMRIPKSYSPGSTWTFNTYLGGVVQETRSAANASGGDPANPSGADDLYGLITTKNFDSVGISLNGGSSTLNDEIHTYEFCSQR